MGFLQDYEPVEDRIAKFWADHPTGRIKTFLDHHEGGDYIVRAVIYRDVDEPPAATGYAHDSAAQLPANMKASALEVCETSAIGRALANLGYAPKGKRPSREEMHKAAGTGKAEGPPPVPADSSGPTAAEAQRTQGGNAQPPRDGGGPDTSSGDGAAAAVRAPTDDAATGAAPSPDTSSASERREKTGAGTADTAGASDTAHPATKAGDGGVSEEAVASPSACLHLKGVSDKKPNGDPMPVGKVRCLDRGCVIEEGAA